MANYHPYNKRLPDAGFLAKSRGKAGRSTDRSGRNAGILQLPGIRSEIPHKPDDKSWKVLTVGADISLSPDGSSAIYSGDSSLQRSDLASGLSTPFEGTGKNDRGPLWSPDGSRIAFTRGPESGLLGGPGPYNLILANPDGTEQKALLANADANTAQSWMPDG